MDVGTITDHLPKLSRKKRDAKAKKAKKTKAALAKPANNMLDMATLIRDGVWATRETISGTMKSSADAAAATKRYLREKISSAKESIIPSDGVIDLKLKTASAALSGLIDEQKDGLPEYAELAASSVPFIGSFISDYFKREPGENECITLAGLRMGGIRDSIAAQFKFNARDLMEESTYHDINVANWRNISKGLDETNMPKIMNLKYDNGKYIPFEFMIMYQCKRHTDKSAADRWSGVGYGECSFANGKKKTSVNVGDRCMTPCVRGVPRPVRGPGWEKESSKFMNNPIKETIKAGCLIHRCCLNPRKELILCDDCGGENLGMEVYVFNILEIVRQLSAMACSACSLSGACGLTEVTYGNVIYNPVTQHKMSNGDLDKIRTLYDEAIVLYTKRVSRLGQIHHVAEVGAEVVVAGLIAASITGFVGIPAAAAGGFGLLLSKFKTYSVVAVELMDVWSELDAIKIVNGENSDAMRYELGKRFTTVVLQGLVQKYTSLIKLESGPTIKAAESSKYKLITETLLSHEWPALLSKKAGEKWLNTPASRQGILLATNHLLGKLDEYIKKKITVTTKGDELMKMLVDSGDAILLLETNKHIKLIHKWKSGWKSENTYQIEEFDMEMNDLIYAQQHSLSEKFPMTDGALSHREIVDTILKSCPKIPHRIKDRLMDKLKSARENISLRKNQQIHLGISPAHSSPSAYSSPPTRPAYSSPPAHRMSVYPQAVGGVFYGGSVNDISDDYKTIVNPGTNRKVNVQSKLGKQILKKYIKTMNNSLKL